MRGGHHHHHGGPGRGFGGPFGPGPGPRPFGPPGPAFGLFGPPVGIWGGGRFCRRGPPPRYGYHGYYYNHPGLVLGTAFVAGAVAASSCRHNVYVRNRTQVTIIDSSTPVKRYYVDIPPDIYPGETFRVVLDGEEMLITCPEVSGPGERIIVCVDVSHLHHPNQPPVVAPQQVTYANTAAAPVYSNNTAYPSGNVVQPQPQPQPAPAYYPNASAPTSVPTATAVTSNGQYDGSYATAVPVANTTNSPYTPPIEKNRNANTNSSPFSGFSALPAPNSTTTPPINSGGVPTATSTADVTTCPKCTYFNPSVAHFCQMCGGQLHP